MSKERKLIEDLPVIRPRPLSFAISALIMAPAATAVAQDQAGDRGDIMLEEVTVTARKRSEDLQMVPESIQAISSQTIEQGGFRSMEDYVRFIPSLNIVEANPGNAMVVFRGVADSQSTFIAEPSAAVYLDEQSMVLNAQPNPRMVDIERVEALSGPQGTLYGASSQSGVLRIVTKKPDPTAFDAYIDLDLSSTKSGDMSYDASGMINIPLSESFALRLVGFNAKDGGFIDNVTGTTPRFQLYTNAGSEEKNFNDVKYSGGRIQAAWLVNDSWSVLGTVNYQKTDSNGRPEHDPVYAGDLKVVRFNPQFEYDRQDWTQYALTIEGDLGFADFVSATSYFTRDWTYTQDTSVGYASYFGTFCYAPYWVAYCRYAFQPDSLSYNAYQGVYYNDPIGHLQNVQKNKKFSQEFRLFHQGETFDWVAGFFYEDSEEEWEFTTFTDGFDESRAMANYLNGNMVDEGNPIPSVLPGGAWWLSADKTKWKQWAIFGEVTWHITDRWDATIGARWFDRKMDKTFWLELPRYNSTSEGPSYPTSSENDWVPKASIAFNITDDNMVYALYSEGFRPGGTNRGRGEPYFPLQYDSDKLDNFEIGTKNTFAGGRVRLNATLFDMKWKDYQLEVVDPSTIPCGEPTAKPEPTCGQPWQKVVANVGNASSTGVEVQLDWAATANLTIGANATWLDSKLDEEVEVSVVVPKGQRLPLSPEFKGSAYAQYDWDVDWFGGSSAWVRLQWSYTGDMYNQVEPIQSTDPDADNYGPAPQILQPSYNIGDIRFGLDHNNWNLQLYINNLTDERAVLFANPFEFDYFTFDNEYGGTPTARSRVTVNRPREIGIRWIQHFGG